MNGGTQRTRTYSYNAVLLVGGILFIFAAIFFIALLAQGEETQRALLDLSGQVLGPALAATIAWSGVSRTIRNHRRQEILKDWHANVRWACEAYQNAKDDVGQELAVAILGTLDSHPELEEPEQALIDAVLNSIMLNRQS
ncbi:hypothetical protein G7Y31_08950 [Corynebacterium lizhenjunii]|uniref:Uncharacterized protein n=1 Tax=Corynebacterium lizhenjunii TaxID=2709394 RepID=A0A7T0KDB1_9CORY|nr:hypothetical protein [Corynebacterium lizhenjunii]QPK78668.1 hypothetical protein G7Y31_08950 [Corynebacterium lizhenjunii]